MKYFKLAYDMLTHKLLFNIIIIIEIAAVLTLTNIVISAYNGKAMLYEPYKEMLQNSGVVIDHDLNMGMRSNHEDIKKIVDKYNYLYYPEFFKLLEEKLQGEIKIDYTKFYFLSVENSEIKPNLNSYNAVQLIGIEHEKFSKLQLPLAYGKWASSDITKDNEVEIVISGGSNAELNKTYNTAIGKLKVVGILTNNTYVPPGISYEDKKEELSIFDYYQTYDCNISLRAPFAIVDRNLYDKIVGIDDPNYGSNIFISYGQVDSKTAENNTAYLKEIGCTGRFLYYNEDFYTIREQSEKYLSNIYLRMLPIMIAALIVIIAGLTGAMSMSAVKEMKTFGILYLCGCHWQNCKKIISAQTTIIISLSIILTIFTLSVMKIMNIGYLIGASFDWNNIYISFIELAIMYLLSVIIPRNIISNSSPTTVIKEN